MSANIFNVLLSTLSRRLHNRYCISQSAALSCCRSGKFSLNPTHSTWLNHHFLLLKETGCERQICMWFQGPFSYKSAKQ